MGVKILLEPRGSIVSLAVNGGGVASQTVPPNVLLQNPVNSVKGIPELEPSREEEGAFCGWKCNSLFSISEPQLLLVTVELRGQRSGGGKGQERRRRQVLGINGHCAGLRSVGTFQPGVVPCVTATEQFSVLAEKCFYGRCIFHPVTCVIFSLILFF